MTKYVLKRHGLKEEIYHIIILYIEKGKIHSKTSFIMTNQKSTDFEKCIQSQKFQHRTRLELPECQNGNRSQLNYFLFWGGCLLQPNLCGRQEKTFSWA